MAKRGVEVMLNDSLHVTLLYQKNGLNLMPYWVGLVNNRNLLFAVFWIICIQ